MVTSREELAKAWDEGHRTPQRLGPDNCQCEAYNESECGCGEYGSNVITPNPYRAPVCGEHNEPIVWEEGGPDMPTVFGRHYCPTCQVAFMAVLDALDGGQS